MKKATDNKAHFHLGSVFADVTRSLLSLLTVFLVTVLAVMTVLWVLYRSSTVKLPQILRTFFGDDTPVTDTVSDNLSGYDCLREQESVPNESPVTVYRFSGDFDTLRALLQAQTSEYYRAVYQTALISGEKTVQSVIDFRQEKTALRISKTTDGKTETWSIPTDEDIVLYENHLYPSDDNTTAVFPSSDAFTPEAMCGIPDIRTVLMLPNKQTEYISYARIDGETVYYLRFHDSTDSFVGEYWVSPEKGLVVRAKSYASTSVKAGELVFSASLTEYTPYPSAEQ